MQQSLILMYGLTILKGYENYKGLLYSLCYPESCAIVDLFYFSIFVNKINTTHKYFLQERRWFWVPYYPREYVEVDNACQAKD